MEKPIQLNGLRPTSRHGVIFGVYLGLFLLVDGAIVTAFRATGRPNALPVAGMVGLWLLGLLIVLLDRPGPVRNWAAPFLLSLCCPYVALWYDVESMIHWTRSAAIPSWQLLLLLNVPLLGGFAAYFSRMYPRCCPNCGLRSLIPLLRLTRPERRLARTKWCASCGETLWKDFDGNWQEERRLTAVEQVTSGQNPHAGCSH